MEKTMKTAIKAVIRKDIRSITVNRQLFITILVVPLVLTLVVPSIFMLTIHFAPEDLTELERILALLPLADQSADIGQMVSTLVFNHILPMFFLMIPIMAASVMAAASFVGEKEQRTLETLLYGPLTVKQLFYAKVSASFLFSMLVSWSSLFVMLLTVETENYFLNGRFLIPGASWFAVMFLVSPAVSLVAIVLIVRGSAKAQNMMEAQQKAAFLVLPVVLLMTGQFSGVMLFRVWMFAAAGAVLFVTALILLKASLRNFNYEKLLL